MGILKTIGKVLKVAATVGSVVPGPWQVPSMVALGGMGAVEGAKKAHKASKQQGSALDLATGRVKETAPLRQRALQMAMAPPPQREDLNSMFADPGNPYARTLARPPVQAPFNVGNALNAGIGGLQRGGILPGSGGVGGLMAAGLAHQRAKGSPLQGALGGGGGGGISGGFGGGFLGVGGGAGIIGGKGGKHGLFAAALQRQRQQGMGAASGGGTTPTAVDSGGLPPERFMT